MKTIARTGTVYLTGAGPGDPELLTVRAVRLLASCDVVLHDDLVPDAVLALVHKGAEVVSVGKRCNRARVTQQEINALMVEHAHAGKSVVRLKSGDPLVFGRAGEEIAALKEHGVAFEIVPGVTAALAAGALLQLPLTDRKSASKLILTTGHHSAEKDDPEPMWHGVLPVEATLVVYMPGRDVARLERELLAAGLEATTPVCAISHAATPQQSHAACRLEALAGLECGPAPLLLLVGRAMESLL